mmetsp:Transcript_31852/g.46433  ORF Transcript_31852/g.46433 Transcript_31852/m.46433 type:complete len:674 (-) Transcript_31852:279-2300(-)
MPKWEGIEDASTNPTRIWLSKEKTAVHQDNDNNNGTDSWKPLRKVDCLALNEIIDNQEVRSAHIESGRATAYIDTLTIRYNFYNSPSRQLIGATWFTRQEKGKEIILHPLSAADCDLVEDLYQRTLLSSSSLGSGMDDILKEEVFLTDESNYKVMVMKNGAGVLTMKKRSKDAGFLSFGEPYYVLQRGYGEYTVEGEEEEAALGPVRHLVFVVHGIGEAMWSRDDVNIPSLVEEMDTLRAVINKKLLEGWKRDCEKAKREKKIEPPLPNRIEILPIEWYQRIHSASTSLMKSLNAATLRSVSALRAIANDVVFDVLMYMAPEFCETTLDCVVSQIHDLYHGFQTVHPTFIEDGGKCSIIGHSLGSVIVWDLLSLLKEDIERQKAQKMGTGEGTDDDPIVPLDLGTGVSVSSTSNNGDAADCPPVGYQAYAVDEDKIGDTARRGAWGPTLHKQLTKTLPFNPDFTFFLGSPLGLFLTLRGAHPVFDEMRIFAKTDVMEVNGDDNDVVYVENPTSPYSSPFTLPSGAIYNIFHPSDPVAYRIEPLLLPQDTADNSIPDPAFLLLDGKGVRLHLKARQLGDNMRKTVTGLFRQVGEAVPLSTSIKEDTSSSKKPFYRQSAIPLESLKFALGGTVDRVDYQLQTGVIDNEYLSAVMAHSNYFRNEDLIDFFIQCARA